jgi:electron transfer flavoprotein alpha subunit
MGNLGIYIELKDGSVKNTNLELLTLAHKANQDATAVIFAGDAAKHADALKEYGVKQVINVSGIESYNPENYADQLAKIIQENSLANFIATHSAQGKDLLPRVAAKLEAPLATDCIGVDFANDTAVKPVYAGKAISHIKLSGECKLYTVRPNTVTVEKAKESTSPEVKSISGASADTLATIKEVVKSVSKKIDLTEAQIIVSGGRGIKSKDNFKIIEEMAQALGAAVGASRAAVDSGYASQDMQVGQTGKTVNPVLYIACGISGAIQHFAGMKTSRIIVAVNKDPEAPIFKKADYGIVGDLFKVVPLLTEELKKVVKT